MGTTKIKIRFGLRGGDVYEAVLDLGFVDWTDEEKRVQALLYARDVIPVDVEWEDVSADTPVTKVPYKCTMSKVQQ